MTDLNLETQPGIQKLEQAVNIGVRTLLADMFTQSSQIDWNTLGAADIARATKLIEGVLASVNALLPQSIVIDVTASKSVVVVEAGVDKVATVAAVEEPVPTLAEQTEDQGVDELHVEQAEDEPAEDPSVDPDQAEADVQSPADSDNDEDVNSEQSEQRYKVTVERPTGTYHDTWRRIIWVLEHTSIENDTWYVPADILALDEDKSMFGEASSRNSILSSVLGAIGFEWNGKKAKGTRYRITEEARLIACHGRQEVVLERTEVEAESAEVEPTPEIVQIDAEHEQEHEDGQELPIGGDLTQWGLGVYLNENGIRTLYIRDEEVEDFKLATEEVIAMLMAVISSDIHAPFTLSDISKKVNALLQNSGGKVVIESRVKSVLNWVDNVLGSELEENDSIFSSRISQGTPLLWRGLYIEREAFKKLLLDLGYTDSAVQSFLA